MKEKRKKKEKKIRCCYHVYRTYCTQEIGAEFTEDFLVHCRSLSLSFPVLVEAMTSVHRGKPLGELRANRITLIVSPSTNQGAMCKR